MPRGPCSPSGAWGKGWLRECVVGETEKKGWEKLLRELGVGRGTGRRLWKGGWRRGKGRREGGRRKVRDGGKETAVLGVRCGARDRDRSLAHRECPRCQMGHPAPSQVKTAGSEGSGET